MPELELKKIQPNRLNPRLEFTKSGLDELSDSIKETGILEPIIVRPVGDDKYEVVVGERRYRAANQAGLDKIPVIIRDYKDNEVMQINLVENIQRQDLSAVEKGRTLKKMREQFPDRYPSMAALARSLGVGETVVKEWIHAADLPVEVQQRIAPKTEHGIVPNGKIDYRTALQISRQIKEPLKLVEVIEHIADRHIPRRIAEQVTRQINKEPEKTVGEVFKKIVDEAPIYLPFSKKHADEIINQNKTQTSRKAKDPRIRPGTIVRAQITHFADLEIMEVYRKRLGDFDDTDALREGGYTLEEFKEVWKSLHGKWDPDETVHVISFRLAKVVGDKSTTN